MVFGIIKRKEKKGLHPKSSMISISNGLSFLRAPLALLFLLENTTIRITAIILAMLSDSIDGYFARRNKSASKFGAILDPAMDKFFVYLVLTILFFESKIELWQAFAMISRDFALCLFGLYILITKKWSAITPKAIRWGKITTAMQFFVLIGITINFSFSWYIYTLFIAFGILAFIELLHKQASKSLL